MELLMEMSLHIDKHQLVSLLPKLDDFNRLFSSTMFWKKIWRRDISSYVEVPSDPYRKYVDIIADLFYIKSLIGNGYDQAVYASLKNQNDYNFTLVIASAEGQTPIVKYVLSKGANHLNTALSYAVRYNYTDIVNLLIDAGATDFNNALVNAAEAGNMELVKKFLKLGANNYAEAIVGAQYGNNQEVISVIRKYQMEFG